MDIKILSGDSDMENTWLVHNWEDITRQIKSLASWQVIVAKNEIRSVYLAMLLMQQSSMNEQIQICQISDIAIYDTSFPDMHQDKKINI